MDEKFSSILLQFIILKNKIIKKIKGITKNSKSDEILIFVFGSIKLKFSRDSNPETKKAIVKYMAN